MQYKFMVFEGLFNDRILEPYLYGCKDCYFIYDSDRNCLSMYNSMNKFIEEIIVDSTIDMAVVKLLNPGMDLNRILAKFLVYYDGTHSIPLDFFNGGTNYEFGHYKFRIYRDNGICIGNLNHHLVKSLNYTLLELHNEMYHSKLSLSKYNENTARNLSARSFNRFPKFYRVNGSSNTDKLMGAILANKLLDSKEPTDDTSKGSMG